jgi:hypothetical protein
MPDVLTIPGLWNSGPQHWQTVWEKEHPSFVRVVQRDFDHPELDEWVETLERAVRGSETAPVLAAHSMGCCLVAHWARRYGSGVRGAFLVAPSDVEQPSYPIDPGAFKPMPRIALPFPSIVAASRNDPLGRFSRVTALASDWGSEVVDLGSAGHLNPASGYGQWAKAESLIARLAALQ